MEIPDDVKKKAARELARRNIAAFALYTDCNYQINWHHKLICRYLTAFAQKKLRRLMVFMPPRHGKSELVSRKLPAFLLGRDPNCSIIATSYSADLAQRMNRDVQRIIDSPEYGAVFPETSLYGKNIRIVANGSFLRNSDIFEVVGHRGTYRSAGVGGGITGMGADYIIMDDVIKNREEANSLTYREKLWDWYTSTLYTRQEKDASILLTVTRWHEDDLAGRLLKAAASGNGDKWDVLSLPAIKEYEDCPYDPRVIGAALWENKFNLDKLADIKKTIGTYNWAALYQQRPSALEGNLFKREWWKYYIVMPSGFDEIIISADCAFKGSDDSDYVVIQVWGRKGAMRYLIDQVRDKMTFSATIVTMRNLSYKWPTAYRKLIEDKANGTAVIDTLKSEITGLIPVNPEGGKIVRAQAASPLVEAGNICIPAPAIAPWISDFIEEFASFPNGAHDDQVDSMTQANIYFNKTAGQSFNFEFI